MNNVLREIESEEVVVYRSHVYSPEVLAKCRALHAELVKEGKAPYQVILKVDKFERAQGPGVMGSCYISVFGTLSLIDNASGESVLEVAVNNVKGDTDFVETDRFPKTMTWLCRDLFKLKK